MCLKDCLKREKKYLIALLPPKVSLDEALQEIIVKPILELEKGFQTFFAPSKKEEWFIGSLFAILGSSEFWKSSEKK